MEHRQHPHLLRSYSLAGMRSTTSAPEDPEGRQASCSLAKILTVENQDLDLIYWMQNSGLCPLASWPLCTGCPRGVQGVTVRQQRYLSRYVLISWGQPNAGKMDFRYRLLFHRLRWKFSLAINTGTQGWRTGREKSESQRVASCVKGFCCIWLRPRELSPGTFPIRPPRAYDSLFGGAERITCNSISSFLKWNS